MRFVPIVALALLAATAIWQTAPQATAADGALPSEIFAPGNRVHGMDATWHIDAVQGGWIKARLYRTLDKNPAAPHEPRWIYVPAASGSWTLANEAP